MDNMEQQIKDLEFDKRELQSQVFLALDAHSAMEKKYLASQVQLAALVIAAQTAASRSMFRWYLQWLPDRVLTWIHLKLLGSDDSWEL